MNKRAVFVLGTAEVDAVKSGEALTPRTEALLSQICEELGLDASLVFVSLDDIDAGKNKTKLTMKRIREERGRVLDEIDMARPDFVVCFGPVATACVWGKGNKVEAELLRQAHFPLRPDLPVYVTFSLEALGWKAGLAQWIHLDIRAATLGQVDTKWGDYVVVDTDHEYWEEMPPDLSDVRVVGLDLETYPGLDPWAPDARIRMCVVCGKVGRAYVVQATRTNQFPDWLIRIMENRQVVKTGSNIKFDAVWLRRFGYKIYNISDTSTREHILDESNPKKDLKSLTFKYLPRLGDYSKEHRDLVRERGGWEHVLDEEQYQYCGGDGEASLAAFEGQQMLFLRDDNRSRAESLFHYLYQVLTDIEYNGMCIDMQENARLDKLYMAKLAKLRADITEHLGPINIDSPSQLADALKQLVPNINLSKRKLSSAVSNDEEEEAATNREVLERESSKHPVIATVLEYRRYRTRHSTFIKSVANKYAVKKGSKYYVHPRYRTDVVETYRLSSQQPNGQNIPRKDNDDAALSIKRQFVSRFPGGSILDADQGQIEIRAAAWLSQDKKMIEAIESGEDIHTSMAKIMLNKDEITDEERTSCKMRTFLILYQGGAKKLSQSLGISVGKAQRLIDDYFRTFTQLRDFILQTKEKVKRDLQVVTPFGFTRHFIEPLDWRSIEGFRIERQSFNTLVQNTAACITYVAMLAIYRELQSHKLKSLLIGQVHDSIVVDVYPGEEDIVADLVRQAMELAGGLAKRDYGVDFNVPLKCDVTIGPNWADQHPWEKSNGA